MKMDSFRDVESEREQCTLKPLNSITLSLPHNQLMSLRNVCLLLLWVSHLLFDDMHLYLMTTEWLQQAD